MEAIGNIAVGKTQLEVKTRDLSKMKFEITYKKQTDYTGSITRAL